MNVDKYIPNLPVKLGDTRRTPSYSWNAWKLPYTLDTVREGDEAYKVEWERGSQTQIIYVAEAAKLAGLGDANQQLREAVGKIFKHLAKKKNDKIIYLEPGAGASTLVLFEELEKDGFDLERIEAFLLEPSKERIESLAENLHKKFGLKRGRNFIAEAARDYDAPRYVKDKKLDFVVYVATIHHHPDRKIALRLMYDLMKSDGTILIGDWFNSMWEHPARVYNLLQSIDWETKKEDLETFSKLFPNCSEKLELEDEKIIRSNEQISRFWRSWAKVRENAIKSGEFSENDEIYMLEAHTPVYRLVRDLKESGFDTQTEEIKEVLSCRIEINYGKEGIETRKIFDENPFSLYPDSELLSIVLSQKAKK